MVLQLYDRVSRDHRKLRVFCLADDLVLGVYRASRDFPIEERYGLRSQLRRSAVSVATNIVEGTARRTTREYCHFLDIATGSAAEAQYLIGLSNRLGMVGPKDGQGLTERYDELLRGLKVLVNALPLRE